jgi:RNA-directed DNA polymerase
MPTTSSSQGECKAFVRLSRGRAEEALAWTSSVMTRLGLSLNEAKTSVKDAKAESFDFLGYTLGPTFDPRDGQKYPGASPSRRSVQRIKEEIGDLLASGNKAPWPHVCKRLNRLLAGWSAYFGYGTRTSAYRAVDHHVSERVRRFLAKRRKEPGRGTRPFSWREIHGALGVVSLLHSKPRAAAVGLP